MRAFLAAFFALFAVLALYPTIRPAAQPPPPPLPDTILWAWATKQDLRFLKPTDNTGIAFLDRTVFLNPQGVRVLPRLQPFLSAPGVPLIATVRMESPHTGLPPAKDAALAAAIATASTALQIDFDAVLSERRWYAEFLRELRRQTDTPLLITALESWCEERRGDWFGSLPIREATPMLFRMGPDESRMPLDFPHAPACDTSAGISTDEMPARLPRKARRIYIFHPGSWTPQAYAQAMQQLQALRKTQ
jgi:hypothetical protein